MVVGDAKLEALAATEQAARFKVDVWREPVEKWLGNRKDASINEVLERALGIETGTDSKIARPRCESPRFSTQIGFSKHRPRKGNVRKNRYWRD